MQLLEANRKRLLRQNDWIGVGSSRPLNLRFLSSKEKEKVGRRRRVEGNYGAAVRHRDGASFRMPAEHPLDHTDTVALQHHPDNIRIRIGTDALTTACSTEPDQFSQSHASSEPMLFDQQTPDVEPEGRQDAMYTGADRRDTHAILESKRAMGLDTALSSERTCFPLNASHPMRPVSSFQDPGALDARKHRINLASPKTFGEVRSNLGDSVRTPRIMQHVEGATHPLSLVFEDPVSSLDDYRGNVVRPRDEELDTAHAGDSQVGSVHDFGSGPEHESESEAIAAAVIVDEKQWKSLLDISEQSSSHAKAPKSSQRRNGILQHPATNQRHEEERTNWSQHATQGNEMHSSSLTSASLPSLKRGSQMRTPAHTVAECWTGREKKALIEQSEEEKRWQHFVFGSDEERVSETPIVHRESSAHRARQDSSGYLPLSAAVSSIRSTPFRKTPRRPSRMSDSIQDAVKSAPRMIDSPAATSAGFIEEVSDQDQGYRSAERSAFGEQSVTRTSMQNNASGETDLISSGTFNSIGTFRSGLEHARYGGDSLIARTQASSGHATRRKVKRRSIYDLPDSDEGRIHVVDRDSL